MNKILVVNKPNNLTSSFVVNKLKRFFSSSKAGHSGTLDPLAEGVLVIFLGSMTKIIPFISENIKRYKVKMLLGLETDTLDIAGHITKSSGMKELDELYINKVVKNFQGEYEYDPPQYSAIRVNGKRSYKNAREGNFVEIPKRKSTISSIRINKIGSSTLELDIECSKGTYVRSLVRDIGLALGTFGTVVKLTRTSTGSFSLDKSNDFYDLLRGENPEFYELSNLFPVIVVKKEVVNQLRKLTNHKNVDISLISKQLEVNPINIVASNESPLLIVKNKYDDYGKYICSEIKFF